MNAVLAALSRSVFVSHASSPPVNNPWTTYTELMVAMWILGSYAVINKVIVQHFPVMLANGLTLLIAGIVLFVLHAVIGRPLTRLNKQQFLYLLCQSFVGVFLFRALFMSALHWVSASIAAAFMALTPVFIACLAVAFTQEKLSKRLLLSLLVCTSGLLVCQYQEWRLTNNWHSLLGLLCLFFAVFCEALFIFLRKKISRLNVEPLSSNTYMTWFSTLLFLPFSFWDLQHFSLRNLVFADYFPIVYSALCVSVLGFILWFRSCDRVSTITAGLFMGMIPVSALILSHLFLGESMSPLRIAGIIMVVVGLSWVVIAPEKPQRVVTS